MEMQPKCTFFYYINFEVTIATNISSCYAKNGSLKRECTHGHDIQWIFIPFVHGHGFKGCYASNYLSKLLVLFLSMLLVCKFIVIRLFTLFKGEGFNIWCVHAREIELNHARWHGPKA
jgi:hypothetical protein